MIEQRGRRHFSPQQLSAIKQSEVPRHIAIIPDGNRRWAEAQTTSFGHEQGSKAVIELVEAAVEIGIEVVTIYAFSTENWQRPKEEVDFLMSLLRVNIEEYGKKLSANGVRLETIGDLSSLSSDLQELLLSTKQQTEQGKALRVVLAINYGARDELCRAIKRLVQDVKQGRLSEQDIEEKRLASYLDTASLPDPDLFIRAGGEMRLSNFLLWQLCYSELYVTPVLWPDFSPEHLLSAIKEYQSRKRRFGA